LVDSALSLLSADSSGLLDAYAVFLGLGVFPALSLESRPPDQQLMFPAPEARSRARSLFPSLFLFSHGEHAVAALNERALLQLSFPDLLSPFMSKPQRLVSLLMLCLSSFVCVRLSVVVVCCCCSLMIEKAAGVQSLNQKPRPTR
jgi:hypothetical protein